MRTFLLVLLLAGSTFIISGQERMLTIEEASYMKPSLNPPNLSQLQWMGTDHRFAWVADNSIVTGNVENEKKDTVLRLEKLNGLLSLRP